MFAGVMDENAPPHDDDVIERDEETASLFGDAPDNTEIAKVKTSAYQVLARKYRPQKFEDLIGQEAMVRTLANAFATGRIAHAYMLTGVRGVGKTTTARLIARALNYRSPSVDGPSILLEPPGEFCAAISASRHPDIMEMDAASHTGINDIREILDSVRYAPIQARTKVYIIDEVHMLSNAAFNGLLKTLEEPPPHVKFIFATTEIRKVPVTVLSRCQRFDLKRVEADVLAEHLARLCRLENAHVDVGGLAMIARAAEGSVRDALSLLDQAIVQNAGSTAPVSADNVRDMLGLADRQRIMDLLDFVSVGDAAKALLELRSQHNSGADPILVMRDLLDAAHEVTRAQILGDKAPPTGALDQTSRVKELSGRLSTASLTRLWQLLLKGWEDAGRAPDPLAAAEMALVRVCAAATLPPPEEALRLLTGKSAPSDAGFPVARPQHEAAPETPDAKFSSFDELVQFLGAEREIALQTAIERGLRIRSFQHGKISASLVPGATEELPRRLISALQKLTGEIWHIQLETEAVVQSGSNVESLKERQDRERAEAIEAASRLPEVQAAMAAFPGAHVIEVRPALPGSPAIIPFEAPVRRYKEG
jgi:DNA polymerase III subunit gamma/tau